MGLGLRDGGVDGVARAVADGLLHVEPKTTLGVLWQMAMHFKVRVRGWGGWWPAHHPAARRASHRTAWFDGVSAHPILMALDALIHGRCDTPLPRPPPPHQLRPHLDLKTLGREVVRLRRSAGLPPDDGATLERYFNDDISSGLLQWVRTVCAPHGAPVENFTWSFADGRALCYLVRDGGCMCACSGRLTRLRDCQQVCGAPPATHAHAVRRPPAGAHIPAWPAAPGQHPLRAAAVNGGRAGGADRRPRVRQDGDAHQAG